MMVQMRSMIGQPDAGSLAGTLIRPFNLSLPGYRFYLVCTPDHPREKIIQTFATWLQSVV